MERANWVAEAALDRKALDLVALDVSELTSYADAFILATGTSDRHTRAIADFGGLGRSMPLYATVLIVVTLSSIGLPGLNGFVGEFLILLGAFKEWRLHAILACGGVVLGAVYMLWMVERVLWGPIRHEANRKVRDLNARELLAFAPLLVLIVVMGVYPKPFLDPMHESVRGLIRHVESRVDPGPHTSVEAEEPPQLEVVTPAAGVHGSGGAASGERAWSVCLEAP